MPRPRLRFIGLALLLMALARPGHADEFPPDLVSWTPVAANPVFAGTGGGSWDRKIRERGWVLVEDGVFHLWYTGYNDDKVPTRSLGHATSPDGLNWTRDPANPLSPAHEWIEDVCVVRRGDVYYMFAEGKGDIAHLLTSRDRVHWEEQGSLDVRKVDGSPISPGAYGTPTAWFEDGTWYLFYERGDRGVWLATSKDMKVWTNVQDDPVLAMGPGAYDRYAVAFDQVIKRDGVYYAFYHANAHDPWQKDWTTNVARSRDLIHWEKYPGNPIVRGDSSSSMVVPVDGRLRLYTMHPEVRAFEPAKVDGTAKPLSRAEGYEGCWYAVGPTNDEYKFKYSGGMATYPQQHAPIAVYAPAVDRTFFVYGGHHPSPASNSILHMVSYYDHATGTVPRPAILLDKGTDDAHDNPVLQVDAAGHLWVFSNAHGTSRPSFLHRSVEPYSIDRFERVRETNFSYGNPWILPDGRFLFLHTKYADGRGLHVATSPDGRAWSESRPFAKIAMGDYQISWRNGGTVGTAFDHHPRPLGLDARTNLYYLQSDDGGATWKTPSGVVATLPITDPDNPALVRDFAAEKKLVYLKDLNFDADGRPVILFLTSDGHEPGPRNGPHQWSTARWTGSEWQVRPFTASDHNYDHGSLFIEPDGLWRVIAPTEPGPQPFGTGGEMVLWTSADQGATWARVKQLTSNSPRNHTYARRPFAARPDFYALWADGDARARSGSSLYFTDRLGTHVWRLPTRMEHDAERPEVVE